MFLIRYIKYSFDFKTLLKRREEPFLKVLIYFIILMVITTFPLSYLIVTNDGTTINFVLEDMRKTPINWSLPNFDMEIKNDKLIYSGTEEYINTHEGITYIFNYQGDNYDLDKRQILLKEDHIVYLDGKGNYLISKGYSGFFQDSFDLTSLIRDQGEDRLNSYLDFGYGIEKSFSPYIILYALLRNFFVTIFINLAFVLLMSLIIQVFRFGHAKFMTILSGMKIVMLSTTIPALISFIMGILIPGLGPVVFNLGLGIIVMLVMLVFSRKQID